MTPFMPLDNDGVKHVLEHMRTTLTTLYVLLNFCFHLLMYPQYEDIRESRRAIGEDQGSGPLFSQPNSYPVGAIVLTRCAMKNPNDQILSLRKQIKTQDKRQEARIAEVKRIVKDALKDQIVDNMKWVSITLLPGGRPDPLGR